MHKSHAQVIRHDLGSQIELFASACHNAGEMFVEMLVKYSVL